MILDWLMIGAFAVGAVGPAQDPVADTVPGPRLGLGEVLESVLRTHPALAGAEARREAAAASAAGVRAARLPSVTATGLATQYQEPMVVAPLHGFDITAPPRFDERLYQAHAGADYTLFDGGARGARIRGSASLEAAAASGVASARDAVLVEATEAYVSALTARSILMAHDHRARALEAEASRARLLFEEGRTARLAVLRTEAALSRARAEREAGDEGLRLALRRLARVSGLPVERVRAEALVEVSMAAVALPDGAVLTERAMARNPALAQAAGRVVAAETGVAAARSSYLPRVSLTGRYSAFGAASADLTGEWQAGVQVSYPLFTGGARVSGVARAEAEADAARWERALAARQVAEAVDGAVLAYRSARARSRALEAAVAQTAEVARIEALALASGAGVQTDYLRAEAELLEARSALAEARHAAVVARVRLARATGDVSLEWLTQMTEGTE